MKDSMPLPKPAFTRQNHIGIVVTDTAVRLVQVDSHHQTTAKFEFIFPQPIFSASSVDIAELSRGLKALISQCVNPALYVAVCLPEKYAYSREYVLPKMNLNEVEEAVGWQLEKIFPFPKTEIYTDWKLIKSSDTSLTLLVAAINRQLLDSLKTAFETAGLSPISFEPSASALTRILNQGNNPTNIIIEVDNQGTIATLMIDGISALTATTIIQAATPPAVVLHDIIANLDHLKSRLPKSVTSPLTLVVTGEKATPQLAQLLSSETHLPANLLDIPGLTPAYHTAYAAATSTVLPPKSELSLNLLPNSLQTLYQSQALHHRLRSTLKTVIVLTAVAILIASSGLFITVIRTSALDREIKALPSGVTLSDGQLDVSQAFPQAQRFLTLYPVKTSPEYILTSVIDALNPGIALTNLAYDAGNQTVTLSAVSQSRADIIKLKENLDATKQFSKIVIPLSALENQSNYPFSISFMVVKKD
jgi:hypothetical protein